jgi:hypothetical protein
MGEATEMTGSVTTRCCADAGHAACDQNCADKSGDVVMVDDQGRVFEIANQDKVKGFAGKESYDSFLKPIEPGGRTFLQPAWNKRSESLLSLLKLVQLKIGETDMRQVGVALAVCSVVSTFVAGQSSNAPDSAKKQEVQFRRGRSRFSKMQKSIEAQQQRIQRWVEQVKSRDIQIQNQQRMNQVRSSASRAPQAAEAAKYTEGAEHYGDPKRPKAL